MNKKLMLQRNGLGKKLILIIVVLLIITTTISCLIGYYQYQNTIRMLYNNNGYVVGNIILDNIDCDKVGEYAATMKTDAYYEEMAEYLKKVEEASAAAYIYIIIPNEDETMTYIYDSSGLSIGDKDPMSKEAADEVHQCYKDGTYPKSYFVRKSKKYGYLTSSVLPVKDSKGNVVAVLFVDTFMEIIETTLAKYILNAVMASFIIMIIASVGSYLIMKKTVIKPLDIIRTNICDFANNGATITDTLKQIVTKDELQDLAEAVGAMEREIVEYIANIKDVTAEKERIGAELNVATQIQADMLPSIFPAFPDRKEFDIYATMTPAKEVGGDFYDYFLIDQDHLGIVIADVSGKGVPAALFMVIAKTLIKNRAQMGNVTPAEILYEVNNQLCEGNKAELFVTVWLCIIEISTGKAIAANAGHEYPTIKKAGGEYELIKDKHSPAIATFECIKFKQEEFLINPGDIIFVYTDGVAEATDSKNELFGTDRMMDSLNKDPNRPLTTLLTDMKADIDKFVGEAPQFDDITMLAFEYHGMR